MQNPLVRTLCTLSKTATALLSGLVIVSCASTQRFQLAEVPEVSPGAAATLKFRSVDNFSDVVHHHVIRIDDQPLEIMEPSSFSNIDVNAGAHEIRVTCHTRIEDISSPPRNFSVIDGQARKSVELAIGDERCYKVSFAITNCAVLTEAEPSYCE